ncbi:hypothetical protein RJ639_029822 [Escallonia herrerae]|uniref:Aluminum-activated malate transporter 10 n=1 Tax=Escallonia herrerae TaxID=1293975 RepID=A0AA88WYW5_9ASTE|nr:hypothetical protein RJ639_029822 [Escallonia herrerae]
MAKGNEFSGRLEWRINVPDGTSKTLVPESGIIQKSCRRLQDVVVGITLRIWSFLHKAWEIGVNEPKKFFHCLKVGMALSLVSLFYYMRPLYDGYGTNAIWAVMTVVVVFEYTVGATLCKCVNRAMATFLAGSLGIGVHWVANQCGENFEPIVLELSVFLLAAAATFFRFIPSVKARFDYGLLIFILTFSLVSVSGYRVDKLFEMAHQRLSTIAIGVSICIITSMLFCPVWAGQELYSLINRNLEKLADSLDGCVAEYFTDDGTKEDSSKNLQGYKCVLNSKATEESMANFARWEPAHGSFNFRHPWKQYLKIGSSMRNCAYCIETLNGCISSEIQAPESLKKHFNDVCMRLSSHSSNVLKELGNTMKSMTKSSKTESSVREMNFTVEELQSALKSLPYQLALFTSPALEASNNGKDEAPTEPSKVPLLEILPVTTVASLLIEIAARIEGIVEEVDELANQAEFKPASKKGSKEPAK